MPENNNSLVYRNIYLYRIILNILYFGKYKQRYNSIINQINTKYDKEIIELCFGDTIIGEWCKKNNLNWLGIDINENFISNANKKELNVLQAFIDENINLKKSDLVIISGSLYHFNDNIEKFIENILLNTKKIIILEPIFNLSSIRILKKFLISSSNIESKQHNYRFTKEHLKDIFNKLDRSIYDVKIYYPNWKDLMAIVIKK